MNEPLVATATKIRTDRYSECVAFFLAGSLIREEGTVHSDLDVVVVYSRLARAYRESFLFDGYPVEAFVHDPETLEYFFIHVDRACGIPALPQMVAEGLEIPQSNRLSQAIKERALAVLESGPPALTAEDEEKRRYFVTDLLDDLRSPRSHRELIATGARLYELLADYYFRSNGFWSARGKAIPRGLERVNPAVYAEYSRCFEGLFRDGDVGPVIRLAEELLAPRGGPLFDGYRADAPESWRTS